MIHLNSSHLSWYSYEILCTVILRLARSRLQSTLILPYSFNKSLPSVTKLSMMAFVEKYSISSRQRFGRFFRGHWPCPLKCAHEVWKEKHPETWINMGKTWSFTKLNKPLNSINHQNSIPIPSQRLHNTKRKFTSLLGPRALSTRISLPIITFLPSFESQGAWTEAFGIAPCKLSKTFWEL